MPLYAFLAALALPSPAQDPLVVEAATLVHASLDQVPPSRYDRFLLRYANLLIWMRKCDQALPIYQKAKPTAYELIVGAEVAATNQQFKCAANILNVTPDDDLAPVSASESLQIALKRGWLERLAGNEAEGVSIITAAEDALQTLPDTKSFWETRLQILSMIQASSFYETTLDEYVTDLAPTRMAAADSTINMFVTIIKGSGNKIAYDKIIGKVDRTFTGDQIAKWAETYALTAPHCHITAPLSVRSALPDRTSLSTALNGAKVEKDAAKRIDMIYFKVNYYLWTSQCRVR